MQEATCWMTAQGESQAMGLGLVGPHEEIACT